MILKEAEPSSRWEVQAGPGGCGVAGWAHAGQRAEVEPLAHGRPCRDVGAGGPGRRGRPPSARSVCPRKSFVTALQLHTGEARMGLPRQGGKYKTHTFMHKHLRSTGCVPGPAAEVLRSLGSQQGSSTRWQARIVGIAVSPGKQMLMTGDIWRRAILG